MTREEKITYGSYVVGNGGDAEHIVGKVKMSRSFETGALEFSFLVTASTEAAFATACRAAETAFRTPYQDLTFVLGSATLLDAKQSTTRALDPMPEITKGDDDADTGRSRIYSVRIEYGLPASTGAERYNGLRSMTLDVEYDPARRRTVTISGVITAVVAGARFQYDLLRGSIVADAKTDLGITNWELDTEPTVSTDVNDRLCEFTLVYAELIHEQGSSGTYDAAIVRQRLDISRRLDGPGDTPLAERLATLTLSYSAWVDWTVTTDLASKYAAIRPWLVDKIESTLNGGVFAVVTEDPRYYPDENRLDVSMTVLGQPEGQVVFENRVTTSDDDAVGWEFVPAWTGDPLSAYTYPGPRIVVRTVSQTQRRLGTFTEQDALTFGAGEVGNAINRGPEGGSGGGWKVFRKNPGATPQRLGVGSETMDVTDLTLTTQLRYSKEPTATSPSGSGSGTSTPRVPDPARP
jgi:hypothetical protein